MVIGRGHRREHPQPTFYTTTKKKERTQKYGNKITGTKRTGKKYGRKKVRENCTGGKSTGETSTGKKVRENSTKKKSNVSSGQGLFRLLPVKDAQWSDFPRSSSNTTLSVPIYYFFFRI